MSHLGPRVSALLDGRLDPAEEERCWSHVHSCHSCRDLVEQEGWVKTQLAQLSLEASQTSHDLKSALLGRCAAASGSSLAPPPFPTSGHRPRRGLVATPPAPGGGPRWSWWGWGGGGGPPTRPPPRRCPSRGSE